MLAPVTFLGHISSRPVATMAEMETDKVLAPLNPNSPSELLTACTTASQVAVCTLLFSIPSGVPAIWLLSAQAGPCSLLLCWPG